MENYIIKDLNFRYAGNEKSALNDVSFTISQGEFVTICGKSGCGKSTLLRQLKPVLSPAGERCGEILFNGKPISELNTREECSKIGFVMQNPDNQIVTDKVWHELAFGLESLGLETQQIRSRVAEMASFFGIQTWFHKKVTELSGGQKQLLNLASIMVMQPSVIILDEPTSQLDPIAAQDFLNTISKINRELGTTIVLTEHRLEEAFPISDRVIVMENGKIIADDTPKNIGIILKELDNDMFVALPTAMQVYAKISNGNNFPVTIREGRNWLVDFQESHQLQECPKVKHNEKINRQPSVEVKDVWFRYEKNICDVVKGLSLKAYQGELYSIVGGNGTGKTTALSIISGLLKQHRGEVYIGGQPISTIQNKYDELIGVLPQNPQTLFVKKTVLLDLKEMLSNKKLSETEKNEMIMNVVGLCDIDDLLNQHPYDLSGGEQQRVAMAKILLLKPKILLLDEPTKGMDAYFKEKFASILKTLKRKGVTIIMVSHDVEFCAKYSDRCAMFFDGNIVSEDYPREFFSGKNFYTTAANRISRGVISNAVLSEDIVYACGGELEENDGEEITFEMEVKPKIKEDISQKISLKNIVVGGIFALLFIATLFVYKDFEDWRQQAVQLLGFIFIGISVSNFIPQKTISSIGEVQQQRDKRKLSKRTLVALAIILVVIPLTIYIGIFYLGDRKYYFISLLIIIEILIPFAMVFENRKPQARELVIISVLCAIAVAGRGVFYMIPQFKSVIALVIISGVCFGGETGFLVGAMTGFVSNFFFGQGPWTPWQMFAFGIIGFLAGVLFQKGLLRKTKGSLCIFGGLSTILIYGGIMNPSSVLMSQANPTIEMFVSAYAMGFVFDFIHAVSTVFFLWFISVPMIEKLDRIKMKYGLIKI